MNKLKKRSRLFFILVGIGAAFIIVCTGFYVWSGYASDELIDIYKSRESNVVLDRNGEIINIQPNKEGYYSSYIDEIPEEFKNELIKSEDKYFYFHPGVNPVSTVRALWNMAFGGSTASSTLTQQLAKILLGHEKERSFVNKSGELFYAFALEVRFSKEEILNMYLNSIYLGNQTQGIRTASLLYFGKDPDQLDKSERGLLISTIKSPSNLNPFSDETNFSEADYQKRTEDFKKFTNDDSFFEYKDIPGSCAEDKVCNTTIDKELTDKIREVVNNKLIDLSTKNAKHAAVVVIKIPENEVLAVIGSPDPLSDLDGDQLNMALENRPIGSTIKPFIYGVGFSLGLRPYTLVDDREYKYITALGFAHYPKNFDYKYRGIISLHNALSNSLNVPTVKVLEFIGLKTFYKFLNDGLKVKSAQEFEKYQYGIALGQLEMSLYDLAHAFTVFSNGGMLKSLKVSNPAPGADEKGERVLEEKYVQLINKILSDRDTGSEQFGIASNLNLPYKNYAVKTGTSSEYHDSWTIGYTPDFLVAVWVGNAENSAMDEVAGSTGAGTIWHDVMLLLYSSEYNKNSQFVFDKITSFYDAGSSSVDYGIKGDKYDESKNLLIKKSLIGFPHAGDEFLYEEGMTMPLESDYEVEWYLNNEKIGEGNSAEFKPEKEGEYEIRVIGEDKNEQTIKIFFETD